MAYQWPTVLPGRRHSDIQRVARLKMFHYWWSMNTTWPEVGGRLLWETVAVGLWLIEWLGKCFFLSFTACQGSELLLFCDFLIWLGTCWCWCLFFIPCDPLGPSDLGSCGCKHSHYLSNSNACDWEINWFLKIKMTNVWRWLSSLLQHWYNIMLDSHTIDIWNEKPFVQKLSGSVCVLCFGGVFWWMLRGCVYSALR